MCFDEVFVVNTLVNGVEVPSPEVNTEMVLKIEDENVTHFYKENEKENVLTIPNLIDIKDIKLFLKILLVLLALVPPIQALTPEPALILVLIQVILRVKAPAPVQALLPV